MSARSRSLGETKTDRPVRHGKLGRDFLGPEQAEAVLLEQPAIPDCR